MSNVISFFSFLGQALSSSMVGWVIFKTTEGSWEPWILATHLGALIFWSLRHERKPHP